MGVDVFFVISGFLIGALTLDEYKRTGSINFTNFYARRVRRLLPALALVLVTTVLAAAVLLNPLEDQQAVMMSAAASALFVANIYFWRTTGGYFDDMSDTMPLLHMWSLGVEEQWYLVFPALLIALLALVSRLEGPVLGREGKLLWIMGALAVMGYALCVIGTEYRPRAAFFIFPTRAWEFLFGVCTALIIRRRMEPSIRVANLMSVLGFMGIVWSILILDERNDFPGSVAAIPVLSTCLLLAAGKQQRSFAYTALSLSPLRWVGLVSYSWYLWHWPLVTFPRVMNLGARDLVADVFFGGLLSLVLAALTYRYVERPTRRARGGVFDAPGNVLFFGAFVTGLVVCISVVGLVYARQLEKNPEYKHFVEVSREYIGSKYLQCARKFANTVPNPLPLDGCLFGDRSKNPEIVLWGDSYAEPFSALLDSVAQDEAASFMLRAKWACAPVAGRNEGFSAGVTNRVCGTFNQAVGKEALQGELGSLRSVIVVGRWAEVLGKNISEQAVEKGPLISTGGHPEGRGEELAHIEARLSEFAELLAGRNIRLLLVLPTPIYPHSVPSCLARRNESDCSVGRAQFERFSQDIRDVFEKLARRHTNVRQWDPLLNLCNGARCPAVRDGVVLYRDNNHLSALGALSMKASFRREVWSWLVAPSPTSGE